MKTTPTDHKKNFSKIYADNTWGGSGGGSMPEVTGMYRMLLQQLLATDKIKTVVDFGCGDWMFSHLIDWSGVKYLGIDCVESVIRTNKTKYSSPNVSFECSEKTNHKADLLILKDVLQHWTNDEVVEFLDDQVGRYKLILITNNSDQKKDWQNSKNPHIDTRPLSATFFPLKKYNAKPVLSTNIVEPKETSIIRTKLDAHL